MRQNEIVDSGASNHIIWHKKCFDSNFYTTYNIDQTIQGAGGTFATIGIDNVKITVQAPRGHYHDIILLGVLYWPIIFTNWLSVSCLWKKGWYLYEGIKTLNSCNDDFELLSTPIHNGLYILQIYQILPTAAITQNSIPATLYTWYKRLDHFNYLKLKRFGYAKAIDIKKMKVDKNVLLCKIYIKVKQKRWSLYII